MMKYFSIFFLSILFSCAEGIERHSSKSPDVYIAGISSSDVNGVSKQTATIWKNGQKIQLPGGALGSSADAIVVYDGDVFVSGTIYDVRSNNIPVLWKNSELTRLPLPDSLGINFWSRITSLTVRNGEVYVGGFISKNDPNSAYTLALVWKDGKPVKLENAWNKIVNSIDFSAEDLFVGGDKGYWKNGFYSSFKESRRSNMTKIVENDVFSVGLFDEPKSSASVAAFWKNDSTVALPIGDNFNCSNGSFISISGSNTYVVGYVFVCSKGSQDTFIGYWKNGMFEYFMDSSGSRATSMIVFEDVVYVTGNVFDRLNRSLGVYWVNGKTIGVPESDFLTSIFVTR